MTAHKGVADEIRGWLRSHPGEPYNSVARQFGVSRANVHQIAQALGFPPRPRMSERDKLRQRAEAAEAQVAAQREDSQYQYNVLVEVFSQDLQWRQARYDSQRQRADAAEAQVAALTAVAQASTVLRQFFPSFVRLTDWNDIVHIREDAQQALDDWRKAVDALGQQGS